MATDFPTPRADEFLGILRDRIRDKTFRHCVAVAKTLLSFADKAGITDEQAVNAGLLHDLCKAMKPPELFAAASEYGIEDFLDQPKLLHGPVAAGECERWLGITDRDVLEAIYWHTTGHADWSRVGCALYIADFSEPNRGHPAAATALKKMDDEGFDAALRYAVDEKVGHVRKRLKMDPTSFAFQEWVHETFG